MAIFSSVFSQFTSKDLVKKKKLLEQKLPAFPLNLSIIIRRGSWDAIEAVISYHRPISKKRFRTRNIVVNPAKQSMQTNLTSNDNVLTV